MIRKYQKSDLDALMQIWLEGNLDAQDFIDPSYWHDKLRLSVYEKNEAAISFYPNRGFKLVKKEIDQETGAADCLMEWDA